MALVRVPRTTIGGGVTESETSTSLSDAVLGCNIELGTASIRSLALPLEIDGVWLPTCPSWNEKSTAISEQPSFSRSSKPRATGAELVD